MSMRRTAVAAGLFAAALLIGIAPKQAGAVGPMAAAVSAMGNGEPIRTIHYERRQWRHYWRWDHRPVWDDPWEVLEPTIWGSPEPHYVPADIWARKWHPAHRRHWAHRHP